MDKITLVVLIACAFILGFIVTVCIEKTRRSSKLWLSYLGEMKSGITWIRFAMKKASELETQHRDAQYALDLLNNIFQDAKYYLGISKDHLLTEFGIEVDL